MRHQDRRSDFVKERGKSVGVDVIVELAGVARPRPLKLINRLGIFRERGVFKNARLVAVKQSDPRQHE